MADLLTAADYTQIMRGDTTTETALALASGIVRDYCKWELSQEIAATVDLDSDGGAVLVLPSLYVTNVSSLTLNGTQPDGSSFPSLTSVDWEWRSNGLLLWTPQGRYGLPCGWPIGARRVSVTYDSGYVAIPDAIRAVVASLAQRIGFDSTLAQLLENTGGIQTNQTFSQAVQQGVGLTAIEQAALDRYRIVSVL